MDEKGRVLISVPVETFPHSGPLFFGITEAWRREERSDRQSLAESSAGPDHKREKDLLVRWDPGPAYGSASGIKVPLCIDVDTPCATLGSH